MHTNSPDMHQDQGAEQGALSMHTTNASQQSQPASRSTTLILLSPENYAGQPMSFTTAHRPPITTNNSERHGVLSSLEHLMWTTWRVVITALQGNTRMAVPSGNTHQNTRRGPVWAHRANPLPHQTPFVLVAPGPAQLNTGHMQHSRRPRFCVPPITRTRLQLTPAIGNAKRRLLFDTTPHIPYRTRQATSLCTYCQSSGAGPTPLTHRSR